MDFYNGEDLKDIGCYTYNKKYSYCFGVNGLNAKTAALMFDRVYMDAYDYISFRRALLAEMDDGTVLHSNINMDRVIKDLIPPEIVFLNNELTSRASLELYDGRGRFVASKQEKDRFYLETFIEASKSIGLNLVPFFSATSDGPEADENSGVIATRVILENVPLANTEESEWEQVHDFRNDKDRIAKLRAVRRLYGKLSTASSEQDAQDILSGALEQYKLSLEYHGFSLKKGILELFLDKQTIMATIVSGAFLGSFTAASAAGALCILGNSYLKIKESRIKDNQLLLNSEGEAALIHDIQNEFGTSEDRAKA